MRSGEEGELNFGVIPGFGLWIIIECVFAEDELRWYRVIHVLREIRAFFCEKP